MFLWHFFQVTLILHFSGLIWNFIVAVLFIYKFSLQINAIFELASISSCFFLNSHYNQTQSQNEYQTELNHLISGLLLESLRLKFTSNPVVKNFHRPCFNNVSKTKLYVLFVECYDRLCIQKANVRYSVFWKYYFNTYIPRKVIQVFSIAFTTSFYFGLELIKRCSGSQGFHQIRQRLKWVSSWKKYHSFLCIECNCWKFQ